MKTASESRPNLAGKTIVLVKRNLPPTEVTVWLADATADRKLLELATGLTIRDATPDGRLELSKNVIQYAVDVTRRAARSRFQALLRGVLASRLDCQRVGIITHSTLTSAVKSLGPMFDERVVKVAYFGSGQDRGSNEWHEAGCDLMIVAGTPRLPEIEIKLMLQRFGYYDAINRGRDWGDLRWQGFTPDGKPRIVTGRGYREPLWRQAHRSKVRAAIIQAAGRSRALLDTGCDAVILSTEECGFPVADVGQEPGLLGKSEARVLAGLKPDVPYMFLRNNRLCATTRDLGGHIGLSVSRTKEVLSALESRGLVERIGERSGWHLSSAWDN